jgi:hypothetical protein
MTRRAQFHRRWTCSSIRSFRRFHRRNGPMKWILHRCIKTSVINLHFIRCKFCILALLLLDQWFSTFVRPQPDQFFFYKTGARYLLSARRLKITQLDCIHFYHFLLLIVWCTLFSLVIQDSSAGIETRHRTDNQGNMDQFPAEARRISLLHSM